MNIKRAVLIVLGALIIFSIDVFGGELSSITVTPDDTTAGEDSYYNFTFTTSDTGNGTDVGLPKDGKIVIIFQPGFNPSLATIAIMSFAGGSAGAFASISTSGDTLFLERDSTGDAVGNNIAVSLTVVDIGNHQTAASYIVTIETQKNDNTAIDSGISSPFSITHGDLYRYTFDSILDQEAGTSFFITIYAKDEHNNTVLTFTDTVGLSEQTNTINPPSTGSFISGVLTAEVEITKTRNGNRISATGSGKIGVSNYFNVGPGPLHHFAFDPIDSPQTARQGFDITITAEDEYNNVQTSFDQSVILDDDTHTIFPGTSQNFAVGRWTGSVMIIQSHDDIQIEASRSGITGTSNSFNVKPSALDHFSISYIGTQAAGEQFLITITALDFDNNRVVDFEGTVDISDSSETISPPQTTNFDFGEWTGNVTVNSAYENNRITVEKTGGGPSGNSNYFDVISSDVDHFDFGFIGTQEAGTGFTVTITAKDFQNNTVTSFNGEGELSDETNTIMPNETGSFTDGVWQDIVTVYQNSSNNRIKITGSGKSSYSNYFTVTHSALHHFRLEDVESPQVAGEDIYLTIYAEDFYNNRVTSFTTYVEFNEKTGTIQQNQSGNFTAGSWTGPVAITSSANDVEITTSRYGSEGKTNKFNIEAAALDRFTLAPISTVAAGEEFQIKITAMDEFGNRRTQFTGKVDIDDSTHSIEPTESGNFLQGQYIGNVKITQATDNNRITVQRQGGTETGVSGFFDVSSSSVHHFDFDYIGVQEAGVSFTIRITAKDNEGNTVTEFSATAGLDDETGTIDPKSTTSFSGGVWEGPVSVTKSIGNNKIEVTSSGNTSYSNEFVVNHAALDQFEFETIDSPQRADRPFIITITARDQYYNTVTSFNSVVTLTEATATISPNPTTNFVNGVWSDSVLITQSQNDLEIRAEGSGKNGFSNYFNVVAGNLQSFFISNVGSQAAGEMFPIEITALDAYGNTRTQFTGTVDIFDLTTTIDPDLSGNFTQGRRTESVKITQTMENNRITVRRTGGTEEGNSGFFDVMSSSVDHFDISFIDSPQEAGVWFTIEITAKDDQNNTKTEFDGTVILDDETHTITPGETGSFIDGVWQGDVRIFKSKSNNKIEVSAYGKTNHSNTFDVEPGELDHFQFETINSPQTAGSDFLLEITAQDANDNTVTSFNTYVALSEKTNSITPGTTNQFTAGELSQLFIINKSDNDIEITAESSGKSGKSNLFNVVAGALDRFTISQVASQAAGEQFAIMITALDANSNIVKSFTGTVDIEDSTETIYPERSDNFSDGIRTENVKITQVMINNYITVTRTSGTETGRSNDFDVTSSDVDHFVIGQINSPQYAGQNFTIYIRAEDKNNNTVIDFDGTVTLEDFTNTISQNTSSNFTSGEWSGNVYIEKSWTDNVITVKGSGRTNSSNTFNVLPTDLDHFTFDHISSPQTAGVSFTITITAEDVFYNTVTSFNSKVNLTDDTETLGITSGNFTNGVRNEDITITKSQNDVKIYAERDGIQGSSDNFNIIPGPLSEFMIDEISTQATGEPFALSVTALDANGNQATSFTGKVNISDLTGTVSPDTSENFTSGYWKGNVVISTVRPNNKITVTERGGAIFKDSNVFDVISSDVDHFMIDNISSPKTAGLPFLITMRAEDADSNIATSFSGTATLNDETNTLTPKTVTFTSGECTGYVKITRTKTGNDIKVLAAGKSGKSNLFDVTNGSLDHFVIENIASPQVAGEPFFITITAKDSMENIATDFNTYVNLSDNTNTLSRNQTTNFANGQWIDTVSITKSQADVFISCARYGKDGISNSFNVKSNQVKYIKITDAAGGSGLEVGDRTMTLDDKITLYAAGFDDYDNYVHDVVVNWGVTGDLDEPSPLDGTWTRFDPESPGTSGKIWADSSSVTPDSTGTFTVGAISYVKILSLPNGAGIEIEDVQLTADEELNLYCAGYDVGDNYIGDTVVKWNSTGLFPAVDDSSTSIKYEPITAPASGQISITHPTAAGDATGTITVVPGHPVGTINLLADPTVLPADGMSLSTISSDVVYDADSNPVAEYTLFTVQTDLGEITSTDVSSIDPGIQVAADEFGKISFVFKAPLTGGTAQINARSTEGGNAYGDIDIIIASFNIISVNSVEKNVSQGQQDAPVTMTVKNLGTSTITNLDAGLTFIGPPPAYENRNSDFPVIERTDGMTNIPGGATRTLTFEVDVSGSAHLDSVTINGTISGLMEGETVTIDSALTTDTWLVQSPANIVIERVISPVDTVSQGQENVLVSMYIKNQGQALANVVVDTLSFKDSLGQYINSDFIIEPLIGNPTSIVGDSTKQFKYYIDVKSQAIKGNITIDGKAAANDDNTGNATLDKTADDSVHAWFIREMPVVGINSLLTSQLEVSQGQEVPWYLTMKVHNNGGTAVRLDSVRAKFIIRGQDITNQFDLVYDSVFIARGNDQLVAHSEDSLKITVNKTGDRLGEITITCHFYYTDIGTGKSRYNQTSTGITVVEPATIKISKVIPSQNSVTRNQGQDWFVQVVLVNEGGSNIKISSNPDSTYITFSTGADFTIIQPDSLHSGDLILSPDTIDTLTFTINGTGVNTGTAYIDALVTGIELTTGQQIQKTSLHQASVLVENPADLRILAVEITDTPNDTIVNTNQQIKFDVTLQNNGQDGVKQAILIFQSDGPSVGYETDTSSVKGGNTITESFYINAADAPLTAETFYVTIDTTIADNTNESAGVLISPAVDSTETITIQRPAYFKILDVILPSQIRAGQVEEWDIKVVVTDTGQANVKLNKPTSEDISIEVNGEEETYGIIPPNTLQGGGLILTGGAVDTLIYQVKTTGDRSGPANFVVDFIGSDVNDQNQLPVSFTRQDTILTSASVSLVSTKAICLNYDFENEKLGLVNKGQQFQIEVEVENKGRVKIDSVVIKLTTIGNSQVQQSQLVINSIEHESNGSVTFNVEADSNFHGQYGLEKLTAEILSAIDAETRKPVPIDNSHGSTAYVLIQEPAKLAITASTATSDSVYAKRQEFEFQAVVENLGVAEVYEEGIMAIYIPDKYLIIAGTDTLEETDQASFTEGEIVKWTILTPDEPVESDTFYVSIITPLFDKNIRDEAQIVKNRGSDTLYIQTSSNLLFGNSKISAPEGAKDSVLSTGQDFTIESVVQFTKNIDNVTAALTLPSGYIIKRGQNPQDVDTSLVPISWDVKAPENKDSQQRTATILITGKKSGTPQETLRDTNTVVFRTVKRARLELQATTNVANNILSTGQRFDIIAEVDNKGEAVVKEEALLKLDFGDSGCYLDPQDTTETLIKPFELGEEIIWTAFADTDTTVNALPILVTIHKRPLDENSDKEADITTGGDQAIINIEIKEGGSISNEIRIKSPEGAKDSVLSTYQQFTIEAEVFLHRVVDVTSTLSLPLGAGFSFAPNEDSVKPITPGGRDIIEWKIVAPTSAVANAALKVYTIGEDSSSHEYIYSDTASIDLHVVERADVKVVADITYPYQATDGVVSTGQEFRIMAALEKYGTANISKDFKLELKLPQGQGYTTTDSLIQTVPVFSTIEWNIKAPNFSKESSNIIIEVPVGGEPDDENMNAAANFSPSARSSIISIRTIEKTVSVNTLENRTPNTVAKGEVGVSLLGLEFVNSEEDALSNDIILSGIKLKIQDKDGMLIDEPGTAITRIAAVNYKNPDFIYGEVSDFSSQSSISIIFTYPDTVSPANPDSIDLIVDVSPQASVSNFMVTIDSSYCMDVVEMHTTKIPRVQDEDGRSASSFQIESDFVMLMADNLEDSFGNYPNPFGNSNKPTTTIVYYLKEDTKVDIKIYTLLGELVWSRFYKPTDPQGQIGSHDGASAIIWDAKNDKGHKVLNGVYVAYISTGFGESTYTKIAVLK